MAAATAATSSGWLTRARSRRGHPRCHRLIYYSATRQQGDCEAGGQTAKCAISAEGASGAISATRHQMEDRAPRRAGYARGGDARSLLAAATIIPWHGRGRRSGDKAKRAPNQPSFKVQLQRIKKSARSLCYTLLYIPGSSEKRLTGNRAKLTYSPAVGCNRLCLAGV